MAIDGDDTWSQECSAYAVRREMVGYTRSIISNKQQLTLRHVAIDDDDDDTWDGCCSCCCCCLLLYTGAAVARLFRLKHGFGRAILLYLCPN